MLATKTTQNLRIIRCSLASNMQKRICFYFKSCFIHAIHFCPYFQFLAVVMKLLFMEFKQNKIFLIFVSVDGSLSHVDHVSFWRG